MSTADALDPQDEAVLADSVGLALLVVLETLSPAERLAFVLHDMFAVPFDEISADMVGRTSNGRVDSRAGPGGGCRVAPSPDRAADLTRQREVTTAFLAAARGGDLAALVALLDADVTLTGDAYAGPGGRPAALHGAEVVSRGAVTAAARAVHSQLALIDGNVGVVWAPGGHLQLVLKFTVNPVSRITAIDIVGDPETLRRLQIAVLPD